MNKKQRLYWYPKLVLKQHGEFCLGCGITPEQTHEGKLLIDHIDNNSFHNVIENLQLLCRACNRIKNPSKKLNVTLPMTFSEMKNLESEPKFRTWLEKMILENHTILYDSAVNSGAELTGRSPDTIKRYLLKCTSELGRFNHDEQSGLIYAKGDERILEEILEDKAKSDLKTEAYIAGGHFFDK